MMAQKYVNWFEILILSILSKTKKYAEMIGLS